MKCIICAGGMLCGVMSGVLAADVRAEASVVLTADRTEVARLELKDGHLDVAEAMAEKSLSSNALNLDALLAKVVARRHPSTSPCHSAARRCRRSTGR